MVIIIYFHGRSTAVRVELVYIITSTYKLLLILIIGKFIYIGYLLISDNITL